MSPLSRYGGANLLRLVGWLLFLGTDVFVTSVRHGEFWFTHRSEGWRNNGRLKKVFIVHVFACGRVRLIVCFCMYWLLLVTNFKCFEAKKKRFSPNSELSCLCLYCSMWRNTKWKVCLRPITDIMSSNQKWMDVLLQYQLRPRYNYHGVTSPAAETYFYWSVSNDIKLLKKKIIIN